MAVELRQHRDRKRASDLQRALGVHLHDCYEWLLFVTLTFDTTPTSLLPNHQFQPSRASAECRFNEWIEHLQAQTTSPVGWFRAEERESRSGGSTCSTRLHYHALIACPASLERRDAEVWWLQRCGYARVECHNPLEGGAWYVAKKAYSGSGSFEFSDNIQLFRLPGPPAAPIAEDGANGARASSRRRRLAEQAALPPIGIKDFAAIHGLKYKAVRNLVYSPGAHPDTSYVQGRRGWITACENTSAFKVFIASHRVGELLRQARALGMATQGRGDEELMLWFDPENRTHVGWALIAAKAKRKRRMSLAQLANLKRGPNRRPRMAFPAQKTPIQGGLAELRA